MKFCRVGNLLPTLPPDPVRTDQPPQHPPAYLPDWLDRLAVHPDRAADAARPVDLITAHQVA